MKILDANDPFFAKPWRRWATSLFPLLMAAIELWHRNTGWALLFAAIAAYAFYILIYKGPTEGE